jgi:hypothetical protein
VYVRSVWPIGQEPVENAIELVGMVVGELVTIVVGVVRDVLELEADPGISTTVQNQGQPTRPSTSTHLGRSLLYIASNVTDTQPA